MEGKHLFFDLDRTLWDFEKNSKQALKLLFKEFELDEGQLTFATFHAKYIEINSALWRKYGLGEIKKEELRIGRFRSLMEELNGDTSLSEKMADFYVEKSPYQTHLLPGTHEVLTNLKKDKYHLHIITNGFREVQEIKLKHNQLADYFEVVVCSEDIGKTKPNPEIFQHALELAKAKAKDSCMIGDDYEVDYLGALRSGMKGLFFNYKGARKIRKEDDEIQDLREICGKLPWLFRD